MLYGTKFIVPKYLHLATFTYLSNSNIEAGKSSPWSALDIILDAEEFWLRPVFVL